MKLSDEAINIISYACYPAHMQAAEDFIAKLEAEIARLTLALEEACACEEEVKIKWDVSITNEGVIMSHEMWLEILSQMAECERENEALEKQGDYWCGLYKHKRAEHIATCLIKRWEIDALKGLLKRIREHSTDKHYWGQEIDALLTGERDD